MAVKAFKAKDVSRIVLTRPAVEAGEKLGFLPGDLQQKVDPYLRPLYDGLFDMLGAETYERLWKSRSSKWHPWLTCAAGRWTIHSSFWMRRRIQTPEQMKMFLTRMGVGSKVVVTGDVTQIDLPDRTRSGLVDALQVLQKCGRHRAMLLYRKRTLCVTVWFKRSSKPTKRPHTRPSVEAA